MICFHVEEVISWGNLLFKGLSEDDSNWHTYVLGSKLEYEEAYEKGLLESYREWLGASERLLRCIASLEEWGFEVRGSDEFRRNCTEERGILTDDDKFFVGDALTNLRDEAIDEHRGGRTYACEDGGNA